MERRIAILGCGNLGTAILNGLLAKGVPAQHLSASRRNPEALVPFKNKGVLISSSNKDLVADADIILLGLKPYNMEAVLREIMPSLDPQKHILVSLAAGYTLSQMQEILGTDFSLYRAMPNTAADVASSLTCICSNQDHPAKDEQIDQIFKAIGETVFINENLMDAATVLGACGIAYVLRFMRAMVQGGIQIGFDAKTANTIVNQTVKGAAELLIQRKNHPEYEIDKVTTPKGCTIAGLNEMEHNGFSSALIKGIVSSHDALN